MRVEPGPRTGGRARGTAVGPALAALLVVGTWGSAWGAAAEAVAVAEAVAEDRVGPRVPAGLPRAHAHNDYYHDRPLLDALDHGFSSVEADVFLVGERLLVGHSRFELRPERTLERLYLDPLRDRIRRRGGWVHRPGSGFTLLVDIKRDGAAAYDRLDSVLAGYAECLTRVRDGEVTPGPVTVIVSGDRAWDRIAEDPDRFCGVDGRLGDLGSDRSSHLMPLVSDHWGRAFRWRGEGAMPPEERARLHDIVRRAHARGRRVRFWATPDRPGPERAAVWRELVLAGVDHVNTDDLAALARFLRSELRRAEL